MMARSRSLGTPTVPSSRRVTWWILALAAVLFAAAVGTWQAQAILRFRQPTVDHSLVGRERVVVEGVAYRLTGFHHGADLPLRSDMRDIRDSDVVSALAGAELVQVVLTVEIEDAARRPDSVFCDLTLEDHAGRSWRSDGTVGYEVAGPEASSCTGAYEKPPKAGVPFEVGTVFQVPADVVDDVTVRVRLSGGQGRYLLELRPR
jgi:hypothetical protein